MRVHDYARLKERIIELETEIDHLRKELDDIRLLTRAY